MKNIRFTAYCPIRFTIKDVHPSNLGLASQSNALYDMALLQDFGSVYSWAYCPCMLKGHPSYLLLVNAE